MAVRVVKKGAYDFIVERLSGQKTRLQATIANWVANNASVHDVVAVHSTLVAMWNELTAAQAVPGILTYVRNLEDDQTYDVGAEFTALKTAIATARDAIATALPASGGWVGTFRFEADHSQTTRSFTPAQSAGIRANLQSVVNLIE